MIRFLFWLVTTVLFFGIGHISTLLYTQLNPQSTAIKMIAGDGPANILGLIAPVGSKTMFARQVSPDISYGYCSFDISSNPIRIRLILPPSYWSLGAYTNSGTNFFAISNEQIKSEEFEIVIASEQHKGQLEEGTTIVTPPTTTGLLLFRRFVPDRSLTEVTQTQMKETNCTPL